MTTTSQHDGNDSTEKPFNPESVGMRKKEGVFLLVADKTEEFTKALRYAARLAEYSHSHIGLVYVIEEQGFQHWGNIEERMQAELRAEAEHCLYDMATKVNSITGERPAFYIEQGSKADALVSVINKDHTVKMLILGGDTQGSPGPLVSYFSGKGLGYLRVPLTVVPGHLEMSDIDNIF